MTFEHFRIHSNSVKVTLVMIGSHLFRIQNSKMSSTRHCQDCRQQPSPTFLYRDLNHFHPSYAGGSIIIFRECPSHRLAHFGILHVRILTNLRDPTACTENPLYWKPCFLGSKNTFSSPILTKSASPCGHSISTMFMIFEVQHFKKNINLGCSWTT